MTIKLDNKNYDFNQIEKKYKNFVGPTFQILIDGKNIMNDGVAVSRVEVETTIDRSADMFSFNVVNAYDFLQREMNWLDKYFVVGKYIEIKMGYVDQLQSVFYGLITSVTVDLPSSSIPIITVRGMDVSFLMMRGSHSRSWHKKKYSDVVKMVAKKYVSDLRVDDTGKEIGTITQDRENDYVFLTRLAEITNFDFFVVGKTLYFRKPLADKVPVITLMLGKSLHQFNVEINLAQQVSDVVVVGWDASTNTVIKGKSDKINRLGSNSKTGQDLIKALIDNVEHRDLNVDSVEEAKTKANAILNKIGMELITGYGQSIGIPELRAGRYIKIEGAGKKLSQPYYLTAVSHVIDESGYLTSFKVGGNAI